MTKVLHIAWVALALGLALLLSAPATVFTKPPKDPSYPPVEQASFHQVVFADQDLVVLNNRYPPSGDSGFHAHDRDQLYVTIEHSASMGQAPGGPLKAGPSISAGAVGYGGTFGERRVHRVINGDQGPAQFIVIKAASAGVRCRTVSRLFGDCAARCGGRIQDRRLAMESRQLADRRSALLQRVRQIL